MLMKRILLLIFVLISLNAFSQLQVKEGSFKYVPGGVIDNKEDYTDGNDLPMALIKISTENINEYERSRLVFTGNRATQIIKKPKTGEMWVYISAETATFINIKHPDYGTFKYPLPEELCDYCVYEMVLQYIPIVAAATATQQNNYITIIADQPNASIYIDDQYVSDGFKSLAIGTTHTWKIECDMYHTESGSVTITEGEPVTIEKQLRPAYGYINVMSQPESGAVVFIDNKKVGTTLYKSDKMASGTYNVRVVKDMYKAAEQTFVITDENTTNAVLDMTANFVNLALETDAASDIYIDGQYKGKGKWSGRITDGAHFVEVKKDKHRTVSKNLNLVLGKDENIKIEAPTAITGFLDISSLPVKADIYLNGKHYGTTPRIISDLLIGEYTLKLEKEGCASVTKNIVIEENQTLAIKEQLPTGKEVTIKTDNTGDKIYVDGNYVGTTPLTTNLGYGKHDIKATRGTQTAVKTVEVKTTSVRDEFVLAFGKMIKITTGQSGDKVYVDGTYVGITPITLYLSYGNHAVTAVRAGQYTTQTVCVDHTEKETNVALIFGKIIKVRSSSIGDKIYVDGKKVGNTPMDLELSLGIHDVKVKRGLKKEVKTINVGKSNTDTYYYVPKRETYREYMSNGLHYMTLDTYLCWDIGIDVGDYGGLVPGLTYGVKRGGLLEMGWGLGCSVSISPCLVMANVSWYVLEAGLGVDYKGDFLWNTGIIWNLRRVTIRMGFMLTDYDEYLSVGIGYNFKHW